MHLAKPINITPVMYSGLSERKVTAKKNINTGPIIQFWNKDRAKTFLSLNTSIIFSYFTFAKGGYIIKIRPIAIGIFVLL